MEKFQTRGVKRLRCESVKLTSQCVSSDKKDSNLEKKKVIPSEAVVKRWKATYNWLQLRNDNEAVCSICLTAVEKEFPLPSDRNSNNSKRAFVTDGFVHWKNAYIALPNHEKSNFHRLANELLVSWKSTNIAQHLSSQNKKLMMDNRSALKTIFSTIRLFGLQGLPMRGSRSDERSNFTQFIQTRSENVPELEAWLQRKGHKWTSHKVQNEILELMASAVRNENLQEIKTAPFFALMIDETSDITRLEQISISIRIVSADLSIKEIFLGFLDTQNTKSETIFAIVEKFFTETGLDFKKLRGQCYDGASNVSGEISGLQARIREKESRALFVHCNAHRLNLVVQDAMEDVASARNFIGVVKDLINFIRDSPKRVAEFKAFQQAVLQDHDDNEDCEKIIALAPFCPTRWCMRISSLKRLQQHTNYLAALQFFETLSDNRELDSSISAKANGFLKQLESFEFYFLLTMMVEIFEKIKTLNKELQSSNLCAVDSHKKVEGIIISLEGTRDSQFEYIWEKSVKESEVLQLEEPKLPLMRKVSRRIDSRPSSAHVFRNPKEYYKKNYYEIYDCVVSSLKRRFESDTISHLNELECFSIGKEANIDGILSFYGDDFTKETLIKDRQAFLDITKRKNVQLNNVRDVVTFFEINAWCAGLVKSYFRLIQLLLTVPGSTCTNERSFSCLRRLKNYLRSTMQQSRLNNVATLHIHYEITQKLCLETLMNKFIEKNSKRTSTFALNKVV